MVSILLRRQLTQAVIKVDLQTGNARAWSAAPSGFVGEPVMVPRPGSHSEDDGCVIILVRRSALRAMDIVILNAEI